MSTKPQRTPARKVVAQPKRKPQRIGMSQLHYFICSLHIVLDHLDAQRVQAFWDLIKFRCPELFAAIEADFSIVDTLDNQEWESILFDWLQGPPLRDRNGKPINLHTSEEDMGL